VTANFRTFHPNVSQNVLLKETLTLSSRVCVSPRLLRFVYPLTRRTVQVERLVVDEEKLLDTIPRNSQEAIVSCLSLHWVNDLPGRPMSDLGRRKLTR